MNINVSRIRNFNLNSRFDGVTTFQQDREEFSAIPTTRCEQRALDISIANNSSPQITDNSFNPELSQ
jgi:hypothetical protein